MEPQSYWRNHLNSVSIALAIVAAPLLLLTGTARAQELYVYPAKGQSQAQQDRDRCECHSWAVKQTGFDPSKSQSAVPAGPVASNQPMPARSHVLRGAGRGAALGAVGGAIAGDAGKGAAAGSAMGALAGGMRRRDQRVARNQQQQVASQTAEKSQQNPQTAYHRAMAARLYGQLAMTSRFRAETESAVRHHCGHPEADQGQSSSRTRAVVHSPLLVIRGAIWTASGAERCALSKPVAC